MQHLEYWLWGQVFLEVVLVGLVGWYLLRTRALSRAVTGLAGKEPPAARWAEVEERLTVLETRLRQMEEAARIPAPRLGGERPIPGEPPGNLAPSSPSGTGVQLRRQVEEMFRQGLGLEEIAHRLGLRPAEVKVALDLARLRSP